MVHNNTYLPPCALSEMSMQNVDYCIYPFTRLQKFISSQVFNIQKSLDILSIQGFENVWMRIPNYQKFNPKKFLHLYFEG